MYLDLHFKHFVYFFLHSKFKNVNQDDLWKSLTEVALKDGSLISGMTVKLIMDSWTLQPGYPVLQVERPDNSTAKLTQVRDVGDYYSEKDNRVVLFWLLSTKMTVPNETNLFTAGFYRVSE